MLFPRVQSRKWWWRGWTGFALISTRQKERTGEETFSRPKESRIEMSKFFGKIKQRWEEKRKEKKSKGTAWLRRTPTTDSKIDVEPLEDEFKILWNQPPKKQSDRYHKDDMEDSMKKTQQELETWKSFVSKIEPLTFDPSKGWEPEFLVISGGGMKGLYLPSILFAIKERLTNMKAIAGTSIGGLISGLRLIGGSEEFVLSLAESLDFEWIGSKVNVGKFLNGGYFSERDWLIDFLSCCIHEKFGVNDMTLKEFYDLTKIPFCVNTVCKTDNRSVYLSSFTNSDWTLIEALCATSALPLLFPPFVKDGKEYIDGGLTNNYMIELFPPERTLGIYIGKKHPSSNGIVRSKQETFRFFPGVFDALMLLSWCYAMVSFTIESQNFIRVKEQSGSTPREIQIVVNSKIHVASFDLTEDKRNGVLLHGFSIGLYYDSIQWPQWSLEAEQVYRTSKSDL